MYCMFAWILHYCLKSCSRLKKHMRKAKYSCTVLQTHYENLTYFDTYALKTNHWKKALHVNNSAEQLCNIKEFCLSNLKLTDISAASNARQERHKQKINQRTKTMDLAWFKTCEAYTPTTSRWVWAKLPQDWAESEEKKPKTKTSPNQITHRNERSQTNNIHKVRWVRAKTHTNPRWVRVKIPVRQGNRTRLEFPPCVSTLFYKLDGFWLYVMKEVTAGAIFFFYGLVGE